MISKKSLRKFQIQTFDFFCFNIFLLGIQRGLIYVLPLVITGTFALCLVSFPFPPVLNLLDTLLGPTWRLICENIIQGTFGITSLAVVLGVSFGIAEIKSLQSDAFAGNIRMTTVIALACYIAVLGPSSVWQHNFSNGQGLIIALFTATTSSYLFCIFSSWNKLRLPFTNIGHDIITSDYLTLLPAGALTIVIFATGNHIYSQYFAETVNLMHTQAIHSLTNSNISELGTGLIYTGLSQVLWFFGVHGPNMLYSIETEVLTPAMLENVQAAARSLPPPHIVTKGFIDSFAVIGGSGSTLALIIAILLKGKEAGSKRLCMVALLPALCNVNEPLIFGIPLVFNPIYALPFIVTPMVQTLLAYWATVLDLLPPTIVNIHWSTPVFFSGYASTQSFSGLLMQVLSLSVGVAIYLPFVRSSEKLHQRQSRKSLKQLLVNATGALPGPNGKQCLTRPGIAGYLARTLADELSTAIRKNDQISLMFQPQVESLTGQVKGVESLLRWEHPRYGFIPPPIVVALAEDIEKIDALGEIILEKSCGYFAQWKDVLPHSFLMSVNLSAKQLLNPQLPEQVVAAANRAGIQPKNLQMEITETLALTPDDSTYRILNALRSNGVKIAIDDFGMGHTSLRYLKNFPIDTVKIDRSLTVESENGVNDHIVKSIIRLTDDLKIKTVVEGVETIEQLHRFTNLGCSLYQGHYFSPPLLPETCLHFITSSLTTSSAQDQPEGTQTKHHAM